jgi:Putative metal-binding motif
MLKSRPSARVAVACLSVLGVVLEPTFAQALEGGQNFACVNCHEGQDKPEVVATFSEPRIEPGQSVVITVTTTHPAALVGGVLIDSKGFGTFEIIEPTETHLFEDTPTQVTHVAPKAYTEGQVEFAFRWIAPDTVGPFAFEIWANAANGNLDAHDDSASGITANLAVGCDALWYYADADSDGWGDAESGVYSCEPLPEHVNRGGDCDDQNPNVNSEVMEVCNDIDDNCDGEVDEGFTNMLWVEDLDGDGFGSPTGQSSISCLPPAGYAVGFEDCDDDDPNVNPDAVELPNGRDDNCNGQRDELPDVSDGAGGASATSSAPLASTGPVASSGPAVTPDGGGGGTSGASSGPAASSGSPSTPAGGAGGQATPGDVQSPGAAGAPSLAPTTAGDSSTGCALPQGSSHTPVGAPAFVVVGLALLARWRRARRRGASGR